MDIEKILAELKMNYKKLHTQVMQENPFYAKDKSEMICGTISNKIHAWLIATYPDYSQYFHYCSGQYVGQGTEYSGGREGTYHCWVEILLPNRMDKIIIDGAFAQFYPPEIPYEEKDHVRLRIFMPEEIGLTWYKQSH